MLPLVVRGREPGNEIGYIIRLCLKSTVGRSVIIMPLQMSVNKLL